MANAIRSTVAPDAALDGIKSLQDAAYQQAKAGDATRTVARYVKAREPGFAKGECSDEGKAAIKAGYVMRYNEIREPEVYYRLSESLYVPAADFKGDAAKAEKVTVTVEYAMSFSGVELGRMADTHGPQFKAIIQNVRDATSTYVSNRTSDLKREINRLDNEGKTRTRGQPPMFDVRVADVLKDLQAKCTTAIQRGDTTADKTRLAKAIGAFNAVWKV